MQDEARECEGFFSQSEAREVLRNGAYLMYVSTEDTSRNEAMRKKDEH